MPFYTAGRSAFTLSTATDSLTIVSSGKALRIHMVDIKGLAAASSANEIAMFRGTTAGSSGLASAITPSKTQSGSAAASFAVYPTFASTITSTAGEVLWRFGVNGNGGQDRYVAARPEWALSMASSSYVMLRAVSGGGSVTASMLIEELDG